MDLFDPGGIDRHYVPDLVDGDRYDKRGRAGFGYIVRFASEGLSFGRIARVIISQDLCVLRIVYDFRFVLVGLDTAIVWPAGYR